MEGITYPPFLPAGEFRIDWRWFNKNNKTIIFYSSYVYIKAKGIHQLLVG